MEVLVHELGHFLGAAHSGQPGSVMRPVVGDGLARRRAFRVGFDPENAHVLGLVGDEIQRFGVKRFHELSRETRLALREHYVNLAKEIPRDPAARKYIAMIDLTLGRAIRPTNDQAIRLTK